MGLLFVIAWTVCCSFSLANVDGAADYKASYRCYDSPKAIGFFLSDYTASYMSIQSESTNCSDTGKLEADGKSKLFKVIITEPDFAKCKVQGPDTNRTVTITALRGREDVMIGGQKFKISCDFTQTKTQSTETKTGVQGCYRRNPTSTTMKDSLWNKAEFYCAVKGRCLLRRHRCNHSPISKGCYDNFMKEHGCDEAKEMDQYYNVRKHNTTEPNFILFRGFAYYIIEKDDVATEEDLDDPNNGKKFQKLTTLIGVSNCSYLDIVKFLTWYNVRRKQTQYKRCHHFYTGFENLLKNNCVEMTKHGKFPDSYFATISIVPCSRSPAICGHGFLVLLMFVAVIFF